MEAAKIGKVYKITHINSDDIYIGSTFQSLNKRFNDHWARSYGGSAHEWMHTYQKCEFLIELIKEYQGLDKLGLSAMEQLHINKENPAINKCPAFNPISGRCHHLTNKKGYPEQAIFRRKHNCHICK